MARGFSASERRTSLSPPSFRLKEVVAQLSKGGAKAKKHADFIKKNEATIAKALADPSFASTLYAPSPSDDKNRAKSVIQREIYEAYKAAGRLGELATGIKMRPSELFERFGRDANKETMVETDKDGNVVVAISGRFLGVSDSTALERYKPGYVNRDGIAWHNHPDKGPDGRVWGFPPSPWDVQEMLLKGHRTWHIGTLEGSYEMTIKDSSPFRTLEGKQLEKAADLFKKVVYSTWVGALKDGGKGCMKNKERGAEFSNSLNNALKDKLASVGIEYRFKPEQAGFNKV